MTIIALVPALVCLVGLLLWLLAPGKWAEVGKILFGAGLLVTLFVVARSVVKLP